MKNWLLPDGISESLPPEAESLDALQRRLMDLYRCWGYRYVMTPLVEYLESLSIAMGSNLDLQTFKLTDQINGRMMGVRADITPQVARIDAHCMKPGLHQPNRLCYAGTILRTHSEVAGGSRSPIQLGAELFGHAGLESDLEVISLMLETLLTTGERAFVLDIGHVGVLRELMQQSRLSDKARAEYLDKLDRKSLPELNDWLTALDTPDTHRKMLRVLPELHGNEQVLEQALELLCEAGDEVLGSIRYLQRLIARIQASYPDITVHVDLGEMRGYAYHTGIVYAAYLPGQGREIARGGRYDGIGEAFGNARPATGFSTNLRTLHEMCQQTECTANDTESILAPANDDPELQQLIRELRNQGKTVVQHLDATAALNPQAEGCGRMLTHADGEWRVVRQGQQIL